MAHAAEDLDWGGAPAAGMAPAGPPEHLVADAVLDDDSHDDAASTNGRQSSSAAATGAGGVAKRSAASTTHATQSGLSTSRHATGASSDVGSQHARGAPLQPLWLIPSVQAADDELMWEAMAATQLRSHALATPSTATFKDAARFVAFLAVETGGMPRGGKGGGPVLPGAPLVQMAVRTMQDKAEVTRRVEAVFDHLRNWKPPGQPMPAASMPSTAATAASRAKMVRVAAFRHFFVEALRVVSQGMLDPQLAEQVAECEWRAARSHSSVAGALALKAAKQAPGAGPKTGASLAPAVPGIPIAAFTDKLLHFLVLFIANGHAFAAPLERHVTRLLSYIAVCVLQLDVNDATDGVQQQRTRGYSPGERRLFDEAAAGGDNAAAQAPVPRPPGADAPTSGFLPPARPWSQRGASAAAMYAQTVATRGHNAGSTAAQRNAATAPQLRQIGSSTIHKSGGTAASTRLPMIMTHRQVDEYDVPDDLADATVSIGVGLYASRTRPAGLSGASLYSSKASADATALRKALKAFELYAHGPPPQTASSSATALIPVAPPEGDGSPQRSARKGRSPRSARSLKDGDEPQIEQHASETAVLHGAGSVQVRVTKHSRTHPRNAGAGPHLSEASQRLGRGRSAKKATWRTGAMGMHSCGRDGDPHADAALMSGASVPSSRRPRDPEVAKMVSIDGLSLV